MFVLARVQCLLCNAAAAGMYMTYMLKWGTRPKRQDVSHTVTLLLMYGHAVPQLLL